MLSCIYDARTSKGCFREKKTSSIHRRKEFHEQAQRKVSRHRQVCPRTTRTKSDSTFNRLYTSLPCKHLAVPFCIIARAIRRNEKQRVTRYKTKPLFFSLGTCRLSDSCSARVTLARVSSSCARDGEISTHFGNYFDLHHRLQTRARETREVCLIRSDRREKKKLTFFHKRKPLLTFPLKRIRI